MESWGHGVTTSEGGAVVRAQERVPVAGVLSRGPALGTEQRCRRSTHRDRRWPPARGEAGWGVHVQADAEVFRPDNLGESAAVPRLAVQSW